MSTEVDAVKSRLANRGAIIPAATGPMMRTHRNAIFSLTAGELRKICEANPNHPLSAEKIKSVARFQDSQEVHCDCVDIEAIVDNRAITFYDTLEDDPQSPGTKQKVTRKVLGDKITKVKPEVTPKP